MTYTHPKHRVEVVGDGIVLDIYGAPVVARDADQRVATVSYSYGMPKLGVIDSWVAWVTLRNGDRRTIAAAVWDDPEGQAKMEAAVDACVATLVPPAATADEVALAERLRDVGAARAGGGPGDGNYDPELLTLMYEAADTLEGVSGS